MQKNMDTTMTVNERLAHFGLLQPFEKAAEAGDWVAMVAVLVRAQLPEAQAWHTAREVAAHPERRH